MAADRTLARGWHPLDLALLAAVSLLLVQALLGADLGVWLTDQGRDALWAEGIAAGQASPAHGPAAGAVEIQGPLYYHLLAVLVRLGVPPWRFAVVVLLVTLAAVGWLLVHEARAVGRRGALLAAGLFLAHPTAVMLAQTSTNPAWLTPVAALALLLALRLPRVARPVAALAAGAGLGALWMVAVQLHLVAVTWLPALVVALWSLPRGRRAVGAAGLLLGAVVGLVAVTGGVSGAGSFLVALTSGHEEMRAAAGPVSRLSAWLALPLRGALWWQRAGTLSPLGALGLGAHWLLLLLGLVAALVRLGEPERRAETVVLLGLACSGLLLPLFLPSLSFYYVVAGVPALGLAAARGFGRSRAAALAALGALALGNVTALELNRSRARTGQLVAPPGSLWWTPTPFAMPVARATLTTVDALGRAGVGFECAVTHAHGRAWVDAMFDGGYLASRGLASLPAQPCAHLLVRRDGSGRLTAAPLGTSWPGWPPAPVAPRTARPGVRPAFRPFDEVLSLDARLPLRVTVWGVPPAGWGCTPPRPLGLDRFEVEIESACSIVGSGEAVWIDVAPVNDQPGVAANEASAAASSS